MNFYVEYYEEYREQLVRYGWRFDHSQDTAEDLFEDSHLAICEEYPAIREEVEYKKLMKTAMKNRYYNRFKKEKLEVDLSFQWQPVESVTLDEQVFLQKEMEVVMLSLSHFSPKDQEALLAVDTRFDPSMRVRLGRARIKWMNQASP